MNPQILKKCIDKLSEEKPNIPYVLGMLETLREMTISTVANTVTATIVPKVETFVEEMTPEEKEYYAKMAGGTIAQMHDGE